MSKASLSYKCVSKYGMASVVVTRTNAGNSKADKYQDCYIVSSFGGLWVLLHPAIGRNPTPQFAEIGAQHEGPSVGCEREQAPFIHQDARLDAEKYLVSTEFKNGPTGGNHCALLSHIILSYLLPLSAPATHSSHLLSPILGGCICILGLAPSFSPSFSMLKKNVKETKKL